ncbi:DUF481 domain-containing protein [bacterium]|nr:DUF481 domain-containing protein [bacterium]
MVIRIIPALVLTLVAATTHAGTILNALGSGPLAPGWSGGLNGRWTASGGNTEKVLLDTGARVQWRGARDRLRWQVSGSYEESDNAVKARELVTHLRHNRDLGGRWATVAFAQLQSDAFQDLTSRWLLGAGARLDVVSDDRGRLAVGATPMLELERLDGEDAHTARGRLSTFVSLTHTLSETARLAAVGFWQPLFADPGDMRATADVTLAVDVTGRVDVELGASMQYDSEPPPGVDGTDWSTYAGFGIDL